MKATAKAWGVEPPLPNSGIPNNTTSYVNGPTGKNSGPLTVGNYNKTIQKHGKDRQLRRYLKGITVLGSRTNSEGVLKLDEIRLYQNRQE